MPEMPPYRTPFVRPCCGTSVSDFDRETGSVYLPHERDCRFWQNPKRERIVRVTPGHSDPYE